jgi:chromosome segregation ATPase
MLKPQEVLTQTYTNQYKIETLNKSTKILRQIQNEVLKITKDTNNKESQVEELTKALTDKITNIDEKITNTYELFNNIQSKQDVEHDMVNKLDEQLKTIPTDLEELKNDINQTLKTDIDANLNQLTNINNSIQDIHTALKETAPTETLKEFEKTLDLAYSEVSAIKDSRVTFVDASNNLLNDLQKTHDKLSTEIKEQIKENKEHTSLLTNIHNEFDNIVAKLDKLRPSVQEEEFVIDENEDINVDELFEEFKQTQQELNNNNSENEYVEENTEYPDTNEENIEEEFVDVEIYDEDSSKNIEDEKPKKKSFWDKWFD